MKQGSSWMNPNNGPGCEAHGRIGPRVKRAILGFVVPMERILPFRLASTSTICFRRSAVPKLACQKLNLSQRPTTL